MGCCCLTGSHCQGGGWQGHETHRKADREIDRKRGSKKSEQTGREESNLCLRMVDGGGFLPADRERKGAQTIWVDYVNWTRRKCVGK